MSDHRERACTYCGCLLHHEDDCQEKQERRFVVREIHPRDLAGPFRTRLEAEQWWMENDEACGFESSVFDIRHGDDRTPNELERDEHIGELTKALKGLVRAWPKCLVAGCNNPRTNPAYCDTHRSEGTTDREHLPALRTALVVLESEADG